jgi:hypothetical protein
MKKHHAQRVRTRLRLWWSEPATHRRIIQQLLMSAISSVIIAVNQWLVLGWSPEHAFYMFVFCVLTSLIAFGLLEYLQARRAWERQQLRGPILDRVGDDLGVERLKNEDDPVYRTRLAQRVLMNLNNPKPRERTEENRPIQVSKEDWMGNAGCESCGHSWIPMALAERCPQCGLRSTLSETARQRLSPYLARGRVRTDIPR